MSRVGFPVVAKPNLKDLPAAGARELQQVVDNIRQRLVALESALSALTKTTQQSTFSLSRDLAALSTTTTTSTSVLSGETSVWQPSGALPGGTAVYPVSGTAVAACDPTVVSSAFGCIGVCVGPTTGGVEVAGDTAVITVPIGFTPFIPVFAGPGGALTQSPPITSGLIVQVGVALTPGLMLVAPQPTNIMQTIVTGTVDDFLPMVHGETIEVNGLTVGTRREIDFVAGCGMSIIGVDDPANDRVILVFACCPTPGSLYYPGGGSMGGGGGGGATYPQLILSTSGLVAFWQLNDVVGSSTAHDSGPNGLTGTVNGTVTFGASGQDGQNSATFDGSTGFLGIANNSSINTLTAYTIEAWAYATAANDGAGIFAEIFSSNTLMMELGFDSAIHDGSADTPFCGFYNGHSSGWQAARSSSNLVQNAWQYFVGTWDGSALNMYVNGSLVAGPVSSSSFPGTNHAGYVLGRRHDTSAGSPYFAGSLQYVAIYNRALTAAEVASHYAAI